MPVFSIVIPTYNHKRFLKKAVESIVGQSFSDWELIIIDDGSTDGTEDLISKYNYSRINYIYQSNRGVSSARNRGIERACGEYITIKDGGRPDQLSQKMELDKYRIIALIKFLEDRLLTKEQKALVLSELIHKIKIYLKGCIKRNKIDEIKHYSDLLKQYSRP